MKRKITLMLLVLVASFSTLVYAGTPINQSALPKSAQTFLSKYFPNDKVRKAEKDQNSRGVEYEVDLNSGTEVEFTEKGDWKEVKAAKGQAVPTAIVPFAIAKHVAANYSGQKIVEISRIRNGYEMKLSNGSKLKLTEEAKPLSDLRGLTPPRPGRR